VARDVIKAEDIVDYTQKESVAEKCAKRFGAARRAPSIEACSRFTAADALSSRKQPRDAADAAALRRQSATAWWKCFPSAA
jgi:hypothetical protein